MLSSAAISKYFTADNARRAFDTVSTAVVEEFKLHPYHILVEVAFVLALIFMVFVPRKHHVARDDERLTKEEEDELIENFRSEGFNPPALPDPDWQTPVISRFDEKARITVTDWTGKTFTNVINAANFDFLSFATHPKMIDTAADTTVEYGIGSCGPRGFYGSLKPHLQLEQALAHFMRAPTAIVYSCSFASPSTVLLCFAARGDEIICDEACTIQAQQGCLLSRASITYYRHLDLAHVEEIMQASHARQKKKGLPLMRRWLVTEGLFRNTGEIAPIGKLVALAKKYRYRICVDDNVAFGVIGASGRGTPELFGVKLSDVDIYLGSTAMAIGSVGGFCVGSEMITDHQRLACTGYVFSAAACAYNSTTAALALQMLDEEKNGDVGNNRDEPQRPQRAQKNGALFRSKLQVPAGLFVPGARCSMTANHSPVVHIRREKDVAQAEALKAARALKATKEAQKKRIIEAPSSFDEASVKFRKVQDAVLQRGYLVTRVEFNHEEQIPVPPSLRINLKSEMTEGEVLELAHIVSEELKREFA